MSYSFNLCLMSVQDQKEEDGPGSGPQGEKELAAKEDLQSTTEDKEEKKEDQENSDEDEDENNKDPKPNDIQDFDEVGISDAFSAFVYGYPSSCPRAHCTPNKSMPTLRCTCRHGPVYTVRHLLSAVPWISEDRLLCRRDILVHFVFSRIAPLSNSSDVGSVNMLLRGIDFMRRISWVVEWLFICLFEKFNWWRSFVMAEIGCVWVAACNIELTCTAHMSWEMKGGEKNVLRWCVYI